MSIRLMSQKPEALFWANAAALLLSGWNCLLRLRSLCLQNKLPWPTNNNSEYCCRYEFVVSSPPNHSRRLDLTSRIIVQSDGTINPAEGVLGRTITAMIDGVGFLDTNITDIVEVGSHLAYVMLLQPSCFNSPHSATSGP